MKKQRICVVGDGLSGLLTAIALNNLPNLEVHLIFKKNKRKNDKRTTAISASNFNFFQEILGNFDKKLFWPSKKISLFYESNEKKINFLNFNEDNDNLLYVFENDKVKDFLNKEIKKKKKNIKHKKTKKLCSRRWTIKVIDRYNTQ